MLSWLLSSLLSFAATYGPVVLFIIFLLEGALIGKVIPTRALFVAVVVAVGTSVISLVSLIALAVVGATLGQCLLFVLVRYIDYRPGYSPVDSRFVNRAEEWFEDAFYFFHQYSHRVIKCIYTHFEGIPNVSS